LLEIRNITKETLPTYKFLEKIMEPNSQEAKELIKIFRFQHLVSSLGLHRYQVFAMQK